MFASNLLCSLSKKQNKKNHTNKIAKPKIKTKLHFVKNKDTDDKEFYCEESLYVNREFNI